MIMASIKITKVRTAQCEAKVKLQVQNFQSRPLTALFLQRRGVSPREGTLKALDGFSVINSQIC